MRIRKFVCAAVLAAFTCASVGGCYGKYALFNKVSDFCGSVGNKYVGSLVNLVLWIIPAYEICLFGDLVIFNTIEFWTGSNPVAMGDTYQETDEHGNKVYAVRNSDGSLTVNMTDANGNRADFTLEHEGNVIRAKDSNGEILASQIVGNTGDVVAHVAVR